MLIKKSDVMIAALANHLQCAGYEFGKSRHLCIAVSEAFDSLYGIRFRWKNPEIVEEIRKDICDEIGGQYVYESYHKKKYGEYPLYNEAQKARCKIALKLINRYKEQEQCKPPASTKLSKVFNWLKAIFKSKRC